VDLGTAIPASTAIVMAGIALITFLRGRNGNGASGVSKNYVEKELVNIRDALKRVVFTDACNPVKESFRIQLVDSSKHLSEKMDMIVDAVKSGFENVDRRLETLERNSK